MRFLRFVSLSVTFFVPQFAHAEFDNFQLQSLSAGGVLGEYLTFILDIVDPSTSSDNSVVCQYNWYAPGTISANEIPADPNISWNSSTLNENYVGVK